MKKYLLTLTLSLFVLPLTSSGGKEYRTLPVSTYIDKMKGGWIGQMAGVGWAAPTEFYWCGEIIPEDKMPTWQPETINQFNQDDIYVEMTFLRTLDVYGLDVSIRQAGIDFANSGYGLAHANEYGRLNLRKGIAPPDSGHPKFNDHADDIDYQIEADYAGLISPGLPNSGIQLGEVFGRLMNYGDGLYGGQFVAGMYAEAFFEQDMEKVVRAGLKCIPRGSQYHECITDVLNWYHQSPEDWQATWQRIEDKYNDNPQYRRFACNDEENIDAKINGAYIVMGMLYGEGDIDQTIIISTRCGQDSDCNPSSAAGVLCTSMGYSIIPDRFRSALDRKKKFSHTPYNFDSLMAVCEKLARQAVTKSGGSIERDAHGRDVFLIPNVEIRPSKLEQCWEPGPIAFSRFTPQELDQLLLTLKVTKGKMGLDDVTYDNLKPGDFMRKWLVLGPVPYPGHDEVHGDADISTEELQRAFATDSIDVAHFEPQKTIGNTAYQWALLETEYNSIDLEEWGKEDIDFKICYFWAQLEMPQDQTCTLGIGSDDGVKVWLNGELVHKNWSIRGVSEDDDRVRVRFKKGKNQLVLKIQNGEGGWGFCCRRLDD
jgi:hypothetical protein